MEPKTRPVNKKRRYDGTGRRARAVNTRAIVLDVAERRFLADGYAATTVAAIAAAAGVSVETIYKTFRGKPGLVAAIRQARLGGADPIHAELRSDAARRGERDPRRLIATWGALAAEVAPLVSPILLLVRDAAATDVDMAAMQTALDADRRRRMRANARHLRDAGYLRAGVTLVEAVDVLWTFSSPELYELLAVRCGWSAQRYGRFVGDGIAAALLPSE